MRAAAPPKAATITSARTVALSSATNPFSLTAWMETSATNGRTTTRSYESGTDRLSKVVLPTGEGEITYAYDTAGRLQTVTGPDLVGTLQPRTLTYGYDGFLPLSTTWGCAGVLPCPPGTVEGTVSREYDDSFRMVKQRVNGAHEVTYGYDTDDLLTTVTSGMATFEITRDAQKGGLVAATKLTNGTPTPKITDTRTYDAFGDIATYEARYDDTTLLYQVTYTRDDLGRITTKSEKIGKARWSGKDTYNWVYTYDTVGRLDTVTKNSVLVADYDYDANGNRIAGPGLATAPVYDDQDRLITYGSATYAYAPNGELASKTAGSATTTYEYGALGDLRQASLPNADVAYVVDGTGRRVGRIVTTVSPPSVSRSGLLYDGALQPVAATDDVGNVTARYVQATQAITPDVMIGPTATYRVIGDHLGGVRLLVDLATGAIAQRLDYDEFGVVTADSAPGAQAFGFAGGVYDPVTGLVRFGVRDYDASSGRWTAKDPIRFDGGDSLLYGYSTSDPINRTDPSGLAPFVNTLPYPIVVGGNVGPGDGDGPHVQRVIPPGGSVNKNNPADGLTDVDSADFDGDGFADPPGGLSKMWPFGGEAVPGIPDHGGQGPEFTVCEIGGWRFPFLTGGFIW